MPSFSGDFSLPPKKLSFILTGVWAVVSSAFLLSTVLLLSGLACDFFSQGGPSVVGPLWQSLLFLVTVLLVHWGLVVHSIQAAARTVYSQPLLEGYCALHLTMEVPASMLSCSLCEPRNSRSLPCHALNTGRPWGCLIVLSPKNPILLLVFYFCTSVFEKVILPTLSLFLGFLCSHSLPLTYTELTPKSSND